MKEDELYIQLYSIHGLLRSQNIEMGRDADTGGQIIYVLDLARILAKKPRVRKVDIITRFISDKKVSADYAQPIEYVDERIRILRIPCGGSRYMRKERLWPHLDELIDRVVRYIKQEGDIPDVIHTHYADAGYVGMTIASLFGVPFVHTGHSLGLNKKVRLLEEGMSPEKIEKQFNISHRIGIEEEILKNADLIVTSTRQEIRDQYGLYENKELPTYAVMPPGLDLEKFYPYYLKSDNSDDQEHSERARNALIIELDRFLTRPKLPLILSVCRPEKRKNIHGLVKAYGEDKELQELANLAIFAGVRKDIATMEDNERDVLTEMLLLMDKYDLYGKMAIPKKNDFSYEIPELYRVTAQRRGVLINAALTEPFGLTLIEASACGLPIIATEDGGPQDIITNCENGLLVSVNETNEIQRALKKLLMDYDIWNQCSRNGIKNIRKFYSWDSHVDKYLKEISQIALTGLKESFVVSRGDLIGKRLSRLDRMIITDIDNTLLGDPKSLQELKAVLNDNQERLGFAAASGRSIELCDAALKDHRLPPLDIVIASVGAEIYYGDQRFPDRGWAKHISYKWKREKILDVLGKFDFLALQGPETQKEFKISFFLKEQADHLKEIEKELRAHKCHCNLIYSHEKFLDILPSRASKGRAVRYLSYKWDIPIENIMVCGDSGNDEEMLVGESLAVVVANYSRELESIRGRRKVYFAHQPYSAGILEGIYHYRFLEDDQEEAISLMYDI